jgi:hypothetical protein
MPINLSVISNFPFPLNTSLILTSILPIFSAFLFISKTIFQSPLLGLLLCLVSKILEHLELVVTLFLCLPWFTQWSCTYVFQSLYFWLWPLLWTVVHVSYGLYDIFIWMFNKQFKVYLASRPWSLSDWLISQSSISLIPLLSTHLVKPNSVLHPPQYILIPIYSISKIYPEPLFIFLLFSLTVLYSRPPSSLTRIPTATHPLILYIAVRLIFELCDQMLLLIPHLINASLYACKHKLKALNSLSLAVLLMLNRQYLK